jgi:predicted amidophosphoribosyltransferase
MPRTLCSKDKLHTTFDGQPYCPECGAPMTKEEKCPKCGETLFNWQKFCAKCGSRVTLVVLQPLAEDVAEPATGVKERVEQYLGTPGEEERELDFTNEEE